jgi:Lrp/AsnC family transcriptional regulator
LDEFDRKILRTVQASPAITMAELADRVGLSQTPCWRRLKNMEADGLIARRAVILDARKLGLNVDVIANVKIGRHDEATLNAFEHEVCNHPEIVACFSISGDSDFVMRIVAFSIEDYERFLKRVLLHLPGVISVNSNFALKTVKITTDLPV